MLRRPFIKLNELINIRGETIENKIKRRRRNVCNTNKKSNNIRSNYVLQRITMFIQSTLYLQTTLAAVTHLDEGLTLAPYRGQKIFSAKK
jgi:hypothetical protein